MHLGDLDNPPTSTMFNQVGSSGPKKKNCTSEIALAIVSLANALSPKPLVLPSLGSTSRSSPARIIENHGKCYKQLSDLKNLFESGILTEEEYTSE